MSSKVCEALRSSATGTGIIFVEDDDYYRPGWLAWCEAKLQKGYDIVGQGNALFYNVAQRWWSDCNNVRHASLCETAISSRLFERAITVIEGFDNQWFDTRLWRLECNRFLDLPKEPKDKLVIGIKGMPGTSGYSREHRKADRRYVNQDPSLLKLWQVLGEDALAYAPFYKR
jgi:hypothetical protein